MSRPSVGLWSRIRILPLGYSEVRYGDKKYGVTRTDFNAGNSHKIYAEELGGNDFISLNYYATEKSEHLRPCEMSEQKVIDFLNGYETFESQGMEPIQKIGLGGGCHWCTEAVFQSLKGVSKVEQGFVASTNEIDTFSEAVIVHFDVTSIYLQDLIEIHLHTHKSTCNHAMRQKYRSAIYSFSDAQRLETRGILKKLQSNFEKPLITKVHPFIAFKPSETQFKDYFYKNPQKPFCRTYILPKLKLLIERYTDKIDREKISLAGLT